jgi:hypothetical protein
MTEIETVLGKTGSKNIVVETGKTVRHAPRLQQIVKRFRDRLTPGDDPNDAKPDVKPPYETPKANSLYNNLLYRETPNPLVDMTADAREV